jgi:hypothetical protein
MVLSDSIFLIGSPPTSRALTPPLPSGAWHPEHFAALAHYRAARKERVYALSCRVWEFQF